MIWGWLTKVWCWIVGHDTICLKRHTHIHDEYQTPWTTSSAFKCMRCEKQWQEQWDE